MDIAALSTGMAQAKLMNAVGYAVLGKALDSMQQAGSTVTELLSSASAAEMERSVTPYLGANFDMSV